MYKGRVNQGMNWPYDKDEWEDCPRNPQRNFDLRPLQNIKFSISYNCLPKIYFVLPFRNTILPCSD